MATVSAVEMPVAAPAVAAVLANRRQHREAHGPTQLLHRLVQARGGADVLARCVVHDHCGQRCDSEAGTQTQQQERPEQPVEVAAVWGQA